MMGDARTQRQRAHTKKKERRGATQERDGMTARRHHTGIKRTHDLGTPNSSGLKIWNKFFERS